MSAWHKVAGVAGASAIILGAYGAHGFKPKNPVYKEVYQTGSQYHLVHSLLVALAPHTHRPKLESQAYTPLASLESS